MNPMTDRALTYQARLFRGWSTIRLSYALEGDEVVVREDRGMRKNERRVRIADLTGEVHTVFAKQPGYRGGLIVGAIGAMAMLLDFAAAYMMPGPGRDLYWPAWAIGIPTLVGGMWMAWNTRRPREWARFVGRNNNGLFILKDPAEAQACQRFIRTLVARTQGK